VEKTLKLLQEANQRLKTGKVGLTLQLRGNKLSLQGQFPPKPNSERKDPHQQRLSLGLYGNPAGIQRAEAQAKRIAGDIRHLHNSNNMVRLKQNLGGVR
jgi:hypothetical protein